MIEILNLSKSFDNHKVLEDINITIPDKCIFGLVGLNGSGKSTLLRILSNVYTADSGKIIIDGEELLNTSLKRKDILYISDDPFYSSSDSILDIFNIYNIFYNINRSDFKNRLGKMKVNEKTKLRDLSKGMRRQLYIALAFSIVPKILILDEAFDGLDPRARLQFKQDLVELMEKNDMQVIIASHSLRELDDICDRFAILQDCHVKIQDLPANAKQNIYKVQLVLNENQKLENLNLNIVKILHQGKITSLVVKHNKETLNKIFKEQNVPFFDIIELSFEELFIYEVGDDNNE